MAPIAESLDLKETNWAHSGATLNASFLPPAQSRARSQRAALRLLVKRVVGFVLTVHWVVRYPLLTRVLEQLRHSKLSALCRLLLNETGGQVSDGPFVTMVLTDALALSSPQFILGSYEEELHDSINQIIQAAPAQVIDIGASNGYYAVGLALKIARATVTAFEAVEQPFWTQLAELAQRNGVSERVLQRGFCTPEALRGICTAGAFILCDCEGGEAEILNPLLVPALLACTMLIELHEFYRPQLLPTLIERFGGSHHIRILEGAARNPERYAALAKLPRRWRKTAVAEHRWIERDGRKISIGARFMMLTPNRGQSVAPCEA